MDVRTLWFGAQTHNTRSAKTVGEMIADEIRERAPHYATMWDRCQVTVNERAQQEADKHGESFAWSVDVEFHALTELGFFDQ